MKRYVKANNEKLIKQIKAGNPLEITPKQREAIANASIRDYYLKEYPTDTLGKELNYITFAEVLDRMNQGESVYKVIGVNDSMVREGIFEGLSELLGVDYDVIYYLWLYDRQ